MKPRLGFRCIYYESMYLPFYFLKSIKSGNLFENYTSNTLDCGLLLIKEGVNSEKNFKILGFSTLIILSGRFPTGAPKDDSDISREDRDSAATHTTPNFVETELDENLIVHASVSQTNHENLKSRSIHLKNFDEEQIKKVFLKKRTVIDSYESHNEWFPTYKDNYYEFDDESYVRTEPGSLNYQDEFYFNRTYESVISDLSYFIRSDIEDVFKKTELEGMNKDKAIESVRELLNEVGMDDLGEPEVYALDLDSLKSEWEDYQTKQEESPRQWEKKDEAYLVIFPIIYDNVNVTNKGYIDQANQIPVTGSRIMGVVNREGVINLTCRGIYEIGGALEENITPITIETALEKIKEKYKNTLLTDPIRITHISLEYVPTVSSGDDISHQLIPAWVFTAQQMVNYSDEEKGPATVATEFTIMINAETGMEIRNGGEQ